MQNITRIRAIIPVFVLPNSVMTHLRPSPDLTPRYRDQMSFHSCPFCHKRCRDVFQTNAREAVPYELVADITSGYETSPAC